MPNNLPPQTAHKAWIGAAVGLVVSGLTAIGLASTPELQEHWSVLLQAAIPAVAVGFTVWRKRNFPT